MDEHFSIDIAKYTKSSILVGFNLYEPLMEHGTPYKKVFGMIISHADPETKEGQTYIASFNIVLSWNKEPYKNSRTEEARISLVSVIETENIISYEFGTIKAAIPKWSKTPGLLKTK
ncbi:MAG: hypothetical protein V4635_00065 [Bacteroidota bacterium]